MLQVPPVVVFANAVVAVTQTDGVPVIAAGAPITVINAVAAVPQPVV